MTLDQLPARTGHFQLESGYHSDLWLDLDAIFVKPRPIAPLVTDLAERLLPHNVSAICGPLQGGAFLAQAIATLLEVEFYFTRPVTNSRDGTALFAAEYELAPKLRAGIRGRRVAVVDDVISAGSSVRATAAAIDEASASAAVIGTFLLLGTVGLDHFTKRSIPVESLERRSFTTWEPSACPLCASSIPLERP